MAAAVTLTAVTACSSSSPGAQAPVPVAASPSASQAPAVSQAPATTSAAPTASSTSPTTTTASPTPLPLAPPRTPETVAGAEKLTRAYFDALNEVEAKADLAGARLLPEYTLPSCQLCTQYNRNLQSDAISTRKLHGRPVGGLSTMTNLYLGRYPEYPTLAIGSVRFSVSTSTLLDSQGKVLTQGPGSPPTTYLLDLTYSEGQWRVSRLTPVT